jgi:hypothetical protein
MIPARGSLARRSPENRRQPCSDGLRITAAQQAQNDRPPAPAVFSGGQGGCAAGGPRVPGRHPASIIPAPMQAEFDALVSRIERHLLPELSALADELRPVMSGHEVEAFSCRHADAVHSLGVRCVPRAPNRPWGIVVNVLGVTGLGVRGFVYPPGAEFDADRITSAYAIRPGGSIDAFLREMPPLYKRLSELCHLAPQLTPEGFPLRANPPPASSV